MTKRYEIYKDSGVQWLGKIPEHWVCVPFKSVFELGKGLSITKDDLTEEGIHVISYGQIHSKGNKSTIIVPELYRNVSDLYLTSSPQCLVQENDFIIADTSEDVQGSGNFVRVDKIQELFAGYHTIIARNKKPKYGAFVAYLMLSSLWRSQIWIQVHGVKLFSLTRGILNSTKIILPPLSEQHSIVTYLDDKCAKIDKSIENMEKQIVLLQEMKQRIIADAVTRGLDKTVKMKKSGIAWLDEVPEHWEISTLRKFLRIFSEKGHGDKQLLSVTREQGVIVRNTESKEDNHNFIPEDLSGYKYIQEGDFVINKMKSWQGSYGVSKYEGIVSPAYYTCKLQGVNKDFFSMAIRSKAYIPFFGQYSKGIRVDQWDLSPVSLKTIPFILPPIEEQRSIVSYINERTTKIETLSKKIEQEIVYLKEYKQRLISDVVTGQVKVC